MKKHILLNNRSGLRLLTITISCILILLSFSNYSEASTTFIPGKTKWKKYKTEDGKAKIKFPADFEVTTEEKEESTTTKAQAYLGENMFFMAHTIHTTDLSVSDDLDEISVNSFAESVKGKILNQEEFKIREYQIIVMDMTKTIDSERKEYFDSFEILD